MRFLTAVTLSAALLLSAQPVAYADQQYRDETVNPPTNNEPFDEGDEFDQAQEYRDETVGKTFSCGLGNLGGGWIDIFNILGKTSPAVVMHIVLPDGSILDVEVPWMAPGGNWAVELPYDLPADWDCQYTVTIVSYPPAP